MSNPTITMTAPNNNTSTTTTRDDDTDPGYFSEMLTGSSPSSYRGSTNSPSNYHPTTETEYDDDTDEEEQEQYISFANQHNYNNTIFKMENTPGLAYEAMESTTAAIETTIATTSAPDSTPEYLINNNPLQSLLYDAIQSKTLSPDYDTEMMERLDNVSQELQRQSENWAPSINDPHDINALQDWLEQLSANIQTDACLYPEINTSPSSTQLGSTAIMPSNPNFDSELYPNFDIHNINKQQRQSQHHSIETSANVIPDWKAMMMTHSENPLAAYILEQHTTKLPPSIHSENTTLSNENISGSIGANFWTPGNSADIDILPMEDNSDAVPSEAIEFESPPRTIYTKPQPLHLFESSEETSDTAVTKQNIQTSSPHSDKRSMMHMMNVFTAPGTKQTRAERSINSTVSSENKEEKELMSSPAVIFPEEINLKTSFKNAEETNGHDGTESKKESDEDNTSSASHVSTTSSKTTEKKLPISRHSINQLLFSQIGTDEKPTLPTQIKKAKEDFKNNSNNDTGSSPYAEVTDKLRDLTVNDTASAEQAARERHAAIVDRLWNSILRIKQRTEQNKNINIKKKSSLLLLSPAAATQVTPKVAIDTQRRKPSSSKLHDTTRHYQDPRNRLVSV
ncbi:hypothetical protein BDC45DRAFT_333643 [Circinella umbellata]|nr:hypothetical protein BDC45DRAFT_333643 [Circinella umbellata]